MAEFQIGDRVGVLPEYGLVGGKNVDPEGLFGTICTRQPNGLDFGIEFDVIIGGHECGGACQKGYGWFIGPEFLFHETSLSSIDTKALLEVISSG